MWFANGIWVLLMSWPLWWLLGVDQLLTPVAITGLAVLYAVHAAVTRPRVSLPPAVFWALLFAFWSLVPLLWVERLHTFTRAFVSTTAQALILLLFWNTVRTPKAWWRLANGLYGFATLSALAVAVYTLGIWRGEVVTVLGYVLPGLGADSIFFRDLSVRSLGGTDGTLHPAFPFRLHGLALRSTAFSTVCLLLLVFLLGAPPLRRGPRYGLTLIGLGVGLVLAQVRMTYLAVAFGLWVAVLWQWGLFRPAQRPLLIALVSALSAIVLVGAVVFWEDIQAIFDVTFVEARSGSWYNRQRIYAASFALLLEHPIAGWGESVRIPGHSNSYAAGTHSDFLEVLFQRGIVGFGLYLALWASIWRGWWQGLQVSDNRPALRRYLVITGIGLAAFNLQMLLTGWQWDVTSALMVWLTLGMVLTARWGFEEPTERGEMITDEQ